MILGSILSLWTLYVYPCFGLDYSCYADPYYYDLTWDECSYRKNNWYLYGESYCVKQ